MQHAPLLEITKTAAPLRQHVLEALRRSIVAGRLLPGQRLTERELTEMTKVSRTVIREVLRQLESEGLVTVLPNKGPVIRELSVEEATDLYRIRAVLEGLVARLFVENATAAEIEQLQGAQRAVSAAYRSGDIDEILGTKNYFYEVLYRGARSETLGAMLSSLHARIRLWRSVGLKHPNRSSRRSRESEQSLKSLLSAVKKRDADEAEQIMRAEVQKAAAEVKRLLADAPGLPNSKLGEGHDRP